MSGKRWIVCIFIALLLFGMVTIGYRYVWSSPTLAIPRSLSHVQSGDLVLSVGYSFKSEMVKVFEKSSDRSVDYSHIGIFLRQGDSLSIVHMSIDENCIKKEDIRQFIINNKVLVYDVYRMKDSGFSSDRLHSLVDSLLDIRKPFDRAFNIGNDESFYCTEFVYNVFEQAGASGMEKITYDEYLYPNDFVSSGLFVKL